MPFKTKEEAKAYYRKYYQTVRIPKNKQKKLLEPATDSDEEEEEEEDYEKPRHITDTYNEPIHTPFTFQRQHHQPPFTFQRQPQVTNSIRFV